MEQTNKKLMPTDLFHPIGALRQDLSSFFVGRHSVLQKLFQAMEIAGQIPIIYGDRGVGKSSIGWQLFEYLSKPEMRDQYKELVGNFSADENPICLWVECEDGFKNFEDIFAALLSPNKNKQRITLIEAAEGLFEKEVFLDLKSTIELNLSIFKTKFEVSKSENSDPASAALNARNNSNLTSPSELFSALLSRVQERIGANEVYLFIDEFDRLNSKQGVGDFIKHVVGLRAIIIGVAETARELVADHESVLRKIQNVHVPPFQFSETKAIFSRAEEKVATFGGGYHRLKFSTDYLTALAADCGGYPYLAQHLGFRTIRANRIHELLQTEDVSAGLGHYKNAVDDLFDLRRNVPDEEYADFVPQIVDAVRGSKSRRAILDTMAASDSIWLNEIDVLNKLNSPEKKGFHDNILLLRDKFEILRVSKTNARKIAFKNPYLKAAARIAEKYIFSRTGRSKTI